MSAPILPIPLSVYVLTFNSEKYLDALLTAIAPVADELLLVDSGSTDQTPVIALRHGCRFLYRPLDTFRDQREFAMRACTHRYVLMLDSDEIPDAELVAHLAELKQTGYQHDAYRLKRHWYVMGKPVHCLYPVESPDYTVRLVDREKVTFLTQSRMVHERPLGYESYGYLRGSAAHYTFETEAELNRKLRQYTDLAARDLVELGRQVQWWHPLVYPPIVWAKWYVVKGGWRDGRLGWTLGRYVWRYVYRKFNGAQQLSRQSVAPLQSDSPTKPVLT